MSAIAATTGESEERIGKAVLKHLRLHFVFYLVLSAGAVLMVAPFAWMISTALKPPADLFSRNLIPTTITFEACIGASKV